MKLLVTGFDPFGGETVNPAYEAVKQLPDQLHGADLIKLELPTEFKRSAVLLEDAIKTHQPDVVICVGQAGGRSEITPERVAINLADASIPDNANEQPVEETLIEKGPAAYFSTLPVKSMVEQVKAAGLPCRVSYSAGTYVCNSLMYQALHLAHTKYPGLSAGFVHVPYAMEQVLTKPSGTPAMSLPDITRGLEACLDAIIHS